MPKKIVVTALLLPLLFISCLSSHALTSDTKRVRVAVLPFNDITSSSINIKIASVFMAELSKTDFIDVVPLEIIRRNIMAIEPNFLWTEQRGIEKRGRIVWDVEPKVVEEIVFRTGADYTIYGSISWFNTKWKIDAYLSDSDKNVIRVYSIYGDKEEEVPEKLENISKETILLLQRETIVKEAEEEVRRYLGGTYTLPIAIERVEILARSFYDSIPLHAILLNLYLKNKMGYKEKVIDTGLKIIKLYNPSNDRDTKYLLSLNLDPFDAVASGYEEKEELNKAVEIREKALQVFPLYTTRHKRGIGIAAYNLAKVYEQKGEKVKALQYYKKAILYLPSESNEFLSAKEKLNLIEKR